MADNPINGFPALAPALIDVLGHDDPAGARPTSKATFSEVLALAFVSFPFTQNSVPFANATGKLTESTYITFDDTNKRFSVGNGNVFLGTNNTVIGANTGQAQETYAIALGGNGPIAAGINSGVLAGDTNIASGLNSAIAGGNFNQAIGAGSFVAGSVSSAASGQRSVILGGQGHTTGGAESGILYGFQNAVPGHISCALGTRAHANHSGSLAIQCEANAGAAAVFATTAIDTMIVKAGNGIGLQTNAPNSGVTFGSDWAVNRTATAVSSTSSTETIIGVTSTAAARTITLQTADAVAGRIYIIKDESGGAATNNITIACQDVAERIDGVSTINIIVNYGVLRVYSDGTNWFTF